MKLLVAFGLFSFGAAQLRPWPSWLPRFPGGTPKIPPFITIPGAERIPPRIFSGLTDPTENFHIGQDCSVQHEKREYKGTCQNEDDFSKCTWRLPERRVSLWPGAETKSTLFSSFNCVSPPKDTNLCPFAEDIACWVPDLGQVDSPTLYAAAPIEDLSTQGPALDPTFATLQLSSTPSDLNSSPQVGPDILSSPPSIRRRSSKARTASSDLEILAAE